MTPADFELVQKGFLLLSEELKAIRSTLKEIGDDLHEPVRVRAVPLEPNDTIVIEYPGSISQSSIARIEHEFGLRFPGTKVVVLSDGMKMSVVQGNHA